MREKAILIAFGLVCGYGIGFWLNHRAPVVETYKPAVRQADGSLILERKPNPDAKPKQIIPKEAKIERIVSVEVETLTPTNRISVDLTLVSLPDGSKRVIASSPDGTIVGGTDIPVGPVLKLPDLRWAAGGCYSPSQKKYGAFVQYNKGAFIAQAMMIGDNVNVGLGVRF
jgi:hypothetical protein